MVGLEPEEPSLRQDACHSRVSAGAPVYGRYRILLNMDSLKARVGLAPVHSVVYVPAGLDLSLFISRLRR
jgi:hypothetical protein